MLRKDQGIALFTDGSAYYKDGSGGWAFVAIDFLGNEEVRSGHESNTTNNRMEMQAWVEGLDHVFKTLGSCEVLVYCDSEYIVNGIIDRHRNRNKNRDMWHAIEDAIEQHEYVEPIWIKGHSKSYYNGLADQLAGNARKAGLEL